MFDLDRVCSLLDNKLMGKYKYFNIEKGHALFTDNNWKTFKFVTDKKDLSEKYKEELSNSIKYKIRLEHEYGKTISELILKEYSFIEDCYYKITGKYLNEEDGYGGYFEIFAIGHLFNYSYEKVIKDCIVVGDKDGKVDAVVCEEHVVKFFQIKIRNNIDDGVKQTMEKHIDAYVDTKDIPFPDCSDLKKFLDKHFDDIYGKGFEYWTISENSKQKNNVTVKEIYCRFLAKELERSKVLFKNSVVIKKNNDKETVIHKTDDNRQEIFIFANAKDLVDSFEKYIEHEDNIDQLFVDNVRGRLKKNNAIIQTIKNEPEMFCFYNNGVSIFGHFNTQRGSTQLVVYEPIIINGQQTMISLFEAKKNNIDISKVFVPVFLKEVTTEEELRKIAKYNNSQTAINSIDLLSIDKNLKHIQADLTSNYLQDLLDNKECFYLDIIRNGKNKNKDNAKKLFDKKHVITVSEFVKLYSAINDKENIGLWKNNLDSNVNKKYKNGFDSMEKELAYKLCKIISESKGIIANKNEYKIADLTIQFLLYYGYSSDDIVKIIDHINKESDNNHINRANAYRTKNSIIILRNAIEALEMKNLFD